jgi:hypothetical protein
MVIAASLVGLASRLVKINVPVVEFQSPELRLGEAIGDATFDGIVENGPFGVRLRLTQCSDVVYGVPIAILHVATPQIANRAYGRSPLYRSTDVYRGQIREEFSYFSRLSSFFAARFLNPDSVDISFFVRFYSPSDCDIGRSTYVLWAGAILKLESQRAP